MSDGTPSSTEEPTAPLLSVEGVRPPAPGLSLTLREGTLTVLHGPSGSGKSRFLRALADLDPCCGNIRFDGHPQSSVRAPEWRRRVVYLAAESGWWHDRVADHFPTPQSRQRARALLSTLRLPDDALAWDVARASTGERQRLALIRTFTAPEERVRRVYLLDEPTAALDPETTRSVETFLKGVVRKNRQQAILMVSHSSEQAKRLNARVVTLTPCGLTDTAPVNESDPPHNDPLHSSSNLGSGAGILSSAD